MSINLLRRRFIGTTDSRNKIVIIPSEDSPAIRLAGTNIVVKSESCNIKYEICKYNQTIYPPVKAGEEVTILSYNITYFKSEHVKEFTTINNLSIGTVDLYKCTPLERVVITDCPELVAISTYFAGNSVSANLQSVDLSNCPKLTDVNLSHNINLSTLKIDSNIITTLNINFTHVNSLDVTNMLQLKDLRCAGAKFNVLDTSNNENLETLILGDGNIASQVDKVDLSNNKKLKIFTHYGNSNADQLPELDLSNNIELTDVSVKGTFPTLDVSNSPNIKLLRVVSSNLTSLNIGDKPNIKTLSISASKITSVDVNQYTTLTSLALGCTLQTLNLSGLVNLTSLTFSGSLQTPLDISSLVNLTVLRLDSSKLISFVDTSNNTKLSTYSIYNSAISKVDVSNNAALKSMSIAVSLVRKVDLSTCPNITTFQCNNSKLVALNMIGCSKLNTISLLSNPLNDIRCSLSNTTFVNNLKTQLSTYGSGRAGTIYTDDDSSAIADVCASVGWSIKSLSEAPDFDSIE